ncbi:carbon-nitrogen hydrolase family protein [Ferviditalea candida]|uniref:Carbon-nitrogen hydrolase family protein n=1 Tax=Ferviditalea candida TaxID=3108399 RepID=A0ABU5ZMW4_9BACL|nr:carbon-nitrogen hydrolase family protein [Paenibacillaceae bacterium T2]
MTDATLRAAAIQMNCILGDKQQNLSKAGQLIAEAVSLGAKLIVLPELFNTGYRVEEQDPDLAEPIPGTTTDWMMEQAREHDIYLVGCIMEQGSPKGVVYDTAIITGPQGLIGSYRKIYLWNAELTRFCRGGEYPVFELEFGCLGMQICYDVGFPEAARTLSQKGADIIVYPSAFGMPRLYAWDIATRSRALENGVYLIAANRSGIEKGQTEFCGTSRIVNPKGQVLAEAVQPDQVIVADLQLSDVIKQRREIPYLRDLLSRPALR